MTFGHELHFVRELRCGALGSNSIHARSANHDGCAVNLWRSHFITAMLYSKMKDK
jgi:hypothetical protein